MRIARKKELKIGAALFAGLLVWVIASATNVALLPLDRTLLVRQIVSNFIAGLVAVIVSLALQLRYEEVHYDVVLHRAAIMAEINHHVRNAVFPLYVTVQKLGDADSKRTADEAMERINVVLRDATVDALVGRVDYSDVAGSTAATVQ